MKVTEADILRLVHQDSIGIGNIQAVFYDGGAKKKVVVSSHKCEHPVFQLLGFHLPVRHAYLHIRNQAVQDIVDGGKFLHFVVQEENLASTVEFVVEDALDFGFVEKDNFRLDGNAVRRRGLDDGKVPCTQQRKLQGSGNRCSRKGERIHRVLQLAQFFLGRYPEFLLFVDDQQPQVFEFKPTAQNFVSADENVYTPFLQPLFDIGNLAGGAKAAHIFHRTGKILKPRLESLVMLQAEDGGRNQHRHLLGITNGLESRPDGDFRLSETYVSANQAVHGAHILHIFLYRLGGTLLVRSILIHKGRFQLFLKISIGTKGEAFGSAALRIQLD